MLKRVYIFLGLGMGKLRHISYQREIAKLVCLFALAFSTANCGFQGFKVDINESSSSGVQQLPSIDNPTGPQEFIYKPYSTLRSLSNREYKNVVKTILNVDISSTIKLPDDARNTLGYDNDGSELRLLTSGVARYYTSIDEAVERAFNDPSKIPFMSKYASCYASATDKINCARGIFDSLQWNTYRVQSNDTVSQGLIDKFVNNPNFSFQGAVKAATKAILLSPKFIYASATFTEGKTQLSDAEFAKKLALLLWSDLPDNELAMAAHNKQLSDPKVVLKQIERMINSAKFSRFATDFTSQWLRFQSLDQLISDNVAILTPALVGDMKQETTLFIKSMIQENQYTDQLLLADYSFLNARLANTYDIQGNFSNDTFQKTSLVNSPRRGLLSQPSILTLTSKGGESTSLILRGVWILKNILCQDLLQPDANVVLEPEDELGNQLSHLDAVLAHSKNPTCKACHQNIDPLGIGLESFNGFGQFRTDYGPLFNNEPIQPGSTFMERSFNDVSGYAEAISGSGQFNSCVAKNLAAYALGRTVENTEDIMLIRKLSAESDGLSLKGILAQIIMSSNFRKLPTSTNGGN